MVGTLVNVASVVIGSIFGVLLKGKLSEKISETITKGLALCIMIIGISSALNGNDQMLLVISVAVGALIGEIIDIDLRLNNLGNKLQSMLAKGENSTLSEGFVSATLLYCIGAMAILGAMDSGLKGDHSLLFTKSILDGITSIVLASTLGIGVMLSAVSILLYQGSITIFSIFLQKYVVDSMITEVSAVGGVLILGIALNMLKIVNIKVANLLPALFVAVAYYYILV